MTNKATLNALERVFAAEIENMDIEADLSEREAYGELEGMMIAAGRYRNRPAISVPPRHRNNS